MNYEHPAQRVRHRARRATVILEAEDGTAIAYELRGDQAWLTTDLTWTEPVLDELLPFDQRIGPVRRLGGTVLEIKVEARQKLDATGPWLYVKALSEHPEIRADRQFGPQDSGRRVPAE